MSQQREFDEVGAERLAKMHKVLAEMIFKECSEESIRDAAAEFGIDQHEVDHLWTVVVGGDVEPADEYREVA